MINCIIIEDEPLAQRGLLNLIKPFENLNVLSVCDDVSEFLNYRKTQKETPDLIFLDIELPGMNGIDFIRNIPLDIPVVITTAYNQYAIEGYELNVLDYLLKPISKERFSQTVSKAESYIRYNKSKSPGQHDYIYIRSDKVIEKVFLDELVMIEAMRNYVVYHCEKRKLVCYNSLKNAELELPSDIFIKVQKSFIVNKNKVTKIEKGQVYIKDQSISLNRENKNEIIRKLMEKAV